MLRGKILVICESSLFDFFNKTLFISSYLQELHSNSDLIFALLER